MSPNTRARGYSAIRAGLIFKLKFIVAIGEQAYICECMITLSFPNWSDALKAADLPLQERDRHRVIINWYLGYLKRESCPVTKVSARDFIQLLVESRHPQEWQLRSGPMD